MITHVRASDNAGKDAYLVEFGKDQHLVPAIGLLNCAAVCFVNTEHRDDLRGYVCHANSGTVPGKRPARS